MNSKIKKILVGDFSLKRFVRSTFLLIIILYLFLCFLGCFCADKLMFPAPKPSYTDTKSISKLTLPDGVKISMFSIEIPEPNYYILFSHGNGVDIGIIESYLKRMSEKLNCSVYAYDYPGYGTSEGSPSEESVNQSVQAVYKYLKNKGVSDKEILIWGRSVGSGPATYISYKHPVAGLILESAFKSAFRVVTRIQILPFDSFPNIDRIAEVNCPILFIHGKLDRVIPFYHGEALFLEAIEPKSHLWLEKAGHNDVEWIAGEQYWNESREFIKTLPK